jgi:hypothetical protein
MQRCIATDAGSGVHVTSSIDNRPAEFDVSMSDSPVEGSHPVTLGGIHVGTLA